MRPALPGGEVVAVVAPRKGVEGAAPVALRQLRKMIEQMVGEFAPADLGAGICRRCPRSRGLAKPSPPRPDLPRRNFSPMQVRRQSRGHVQTRPIAQTFVLRKIIGDELLQPRPARRLRPAANASRQPAAQFGLTGRSDQSSSASPAGAGRSIARARHRERVRDPSRHAARARTGCRPGTGRRRRSPPPRARAAGCR